MFALLNIEPFSRCISDVFTSATAEINEKRSIRRKFGRARASGELSHVECVRLGTQYASENKNTAKSFECESVLCFRNSRTT